MAATLPPLDPTRVGEDKGRMTIITISTISAISTLFAVARLWVRVRIRGKFQVDDFIIAFSVICGWMSVGFSTAAVHSGSGRHIQTLTIEELQGAILFTMVSLFPGMLSFALPKIAVVILLSRLLNPSRPHLIWLWFMCIFCLLAILVTIGIGFGQCQPPRSRWDFSVPAKFCYDTWILVNYTCASCAFSAFVDLYLSVYPGVVLYNIQLPTKKKIALSAALGIGSISTAVALYKITVLASLASADFTYESCDLIIWTIIEGSVIIIAACIPLLQPLLEIVRRYGWSTKSTAHSAYLGPNNRLVYGDIELSDKSRIRRIRHKFDMDSVLATKNNNEETVIAPMPGSQDRILEENKNGSSTINGPQKDRSSVPPQLDQSIYQTTEVRVSYARDGDSGVGRYHYQDNW
ncbi:hypothetical protein F4806DRAFT_248208 [Annulohypoxylon nitens]|nr:hypothetical protein F4806DRAFT_248208 [Annulohypoxylon nitens]